MYSVNIMPGSNFGVSIPACPSIMWRKPVCERMSSAEDVCVLHRFHSTTFGGWVTVLDIVTDWAVWWAKVWGLQVKMLIKHWLGECVRTFTAWSYSTCLTAWICLCAKLIFEDFRRYIPLSWIVISSVSKGYFITSVDLWRRRLLFTQ